MLCRVWVRVSQSGDFGKAQWNTPAQDEEDRQAPLPHAPPPTGYERRSHRILAQTTARLG
jgi:hypothetical protein